MTGSRPSRRVSPWWFLGGAALLVLLAIWDRGGEPWSTDLAVAKDQSDGRALVLFLDRPGWPAAEPMRAWMLGDDRWRTAFQGEFTFVHLDGEQRPAELPGRVRDANLGIAVLDHDGEWLAFLPGAQDPETVREFLEAVQVRLPECRRLREQGPGAELELGLLLAGIGPAGPAQTWLESGLARGTTDPVQRLRALERLSRLAIEAGRVARARRLLASLETALGDSFDALPERCTCDRSARPGRDDPGSWKPCAASLALTRALVLRGAYQDEEAGAVLRDALARVPGCVETGRMLFELVQIQRLLGDTAGAAWSLRELREDPAHAVWARAAGGHRIVQDR